MLSRKLMNTAHMQRDTGSHENADGKDETTHKNAGTEARHPASSDTHRPMVLSISWIATRRPSTSPWNSSRSDLNSFAMAMACSQTEARIRRHKHIAVEALLRTLNEWRPIERKTNCVRA